MKSGSHKLITVLAAVVLFSVAGCRATTTYPDPLPGWHNGNYSSIFGRLQRIAAAKEGVPPVWVIRFGLTSDPYQGELAITPPEKLIGFSGGEQVEVRGAVRPDLKYPGYPGTWYEVQSIRMWRSYR